MTSACPYCEYTTPPEDNPRILTQWEILHMKTEHPEVIAERLKSAGIHPDEMQRFTHTPQTHNWSSALDEISVEKIQATVKALRHANEMAGQLLATSPKQKAYVANADEVTDALEAYVRERVSAGG